jgi:hypothetical protein
VSSRNATTITLGANLENNNFTHNTIIYQVDGFKPLQVSDGAIAAEIGARGYLDTGFRFMTDGTPNIIPFSYIDGLFLFENGTGAADINSASANGWGAFAATTSYVNYRIAYAPYDKLPIMMIYNGNAKIYAKKYYHAYGLNMFYPNTGCMTTKFMFALHGILSIRVGGGTGEFSYAGYE